MKKALSILTLICSALLLMGNESCAPRSTSVSNKNTQEQKAKQAAQSINFSENVEIDNIKKRLQLTSQPGLLGYVLLLNEAGQPIYYTSVKGKITSGGKRLTPPDRLVQGDRGEWGGDFVMKAPSDEGTHGHSAPYIFFWSVSGQYFQWNGKYLYSDKPFRLTVQPLVVDLAGKK